MLPNESAAMFAGAAVHIYDGSRRSRRKLWRLLGISKGDSVAVLPNGKAFVIAASQLDTLRKPTALMIGANGRASAHTDPRNK